MRAQWRYSGEIRHWVLAEWSEAGEPSVEYGTAAAGSLTAIPPRARERVGLAMRDQHGVAPPARVFDGAPGEQRTLTCAVCWAVSFDPGAVSSRKCPSCGCLEGEAPAEVPVS